MIVEYYYDYSLLDWVVFMNWKNELLYWKGKVIRLFLIKEVDVEDLVVLVSFSNGFGFIVMRDILLIIIVIFLDILYLNVDVDSLIYNFVLEIKFLGFGLNEINLIDFLS